MNLLRWTLAVAGCAVIVGASGLGLSRAQVAGEPEQAPAPEVRGATLHSPVPARARVVKLLAAGTAVKKGDVIGELDAAALRDELQGVRDDIAVAESLRKIAEGQRELAGIALKEYVEGTSELEAKELKLRIGFLEQRGDRPSVNPEDRAGAALERELLKLKLEVLSKYTIPRRLKELEVEVAKAQAESVRSDTQYALAKNKASRIAGAIDACRLVAPMDGFFLPQAREGDAVNEGQPIGRVAEQMPKFQ